MDRFAARQGKRDHPCPGQYGSDDQDHGHRKLQRTGSSLPERFLGEGRRGSGKCRSGCLAGGELGRGMGDQLTDAGSDARGRSSSCQYRRQCSGREGDVSATQTAAKPLPGTGQAAAHRAHGATEATGRLVVGQALEITEDDRRAKPARQAGQFVVEDGDVLAPLYGRFNRLVGHDV